MIVLVKLKRFNYSENITLIKYIYFSIKVDNAHNPVFFARNFLDQISFLLLKY